MARARVLRRLRRHLRVACVVARVLPLRAVPVVYAAIAVVALLAVPAVRTVLRLLPVPPMRVVLPLLLPRVLRVLPIPIPGPAHLVVVALSSLGGLSLSVVDTVRVVFRRGTCVVRAVLDRLRVLRIALPVVPLSSNLLLPRVELLPCVAALSRLLLCARLIRV